MTLLAASMPPPQGFEDILSRFLPYQALGFLVVLVALSALFGLCAVAGWFFGSRARSATPAAAEFPRPAPVTPSTPQAAPVDDPRLLAAIAAAVAIVLEDQAHTIVDIAPAAKINPMTSAWAMEGRFQHFSSHKFR